MRVLLTAYGPFGNFRENVSEEIIVDIFKSWRKTGCELGVLGMPVVWRLVEEILENAFEILQPDLVLFLTHAAGYSMLTLEGKYFNVATGQDELGEIHQGEIIKPDGAEYYLAKVPQLPLLVAYLRARKIPAIVSCSSQRMDYLCNFAGYLAGYWADKRAAEMRYLLLHIPPPEDLPYNVAIKGVWLTLDYLTDFLKQESSK